MTAATEIYDHEQPGGFPEAQRVRRDLRSNGFRLPCVATMYATRLYHVCVPCERGEPMPHEFGTSVAYGRACDEEAVVWAQEQFEGGPIRRYLWCAFHARDVCRPDGRVHPIRRKWWKAGRLWPAEKAS